MISLKYSKSKRKMLRRAQVQSKRNKNGGTPKQRQQSDKHRPKPWIQDARGRGLQKVYCGKNSQYRPFWNKAKGTRMCPRFHSRYYCFDNYAMIDSHVAKDQVPAPLDAEAWETRAQGFVNKSHFLRGFERIQIKNCFIFENEQLLYFLELENKLCCPFLKTLKLDSAKLEKKSLPQG